MKIIDRMDHTYGRLTVLSRDPSVRYVKWLCSCECGNIVSVLAGHLASGHTQSCGCKQSEATSVANTTHGQTGSSEYSSWANMKNRCTNSKTDRYKDYGGRGIKVCSEWLESFEAFYKDMGPKPSPDYTIDRINNDGNYEPLNCRWATDLEQASNTSRNRFIEDLVGKKVTIAQAARNSGLNIQTLTSRLNRDKMSVNEALTRPVEILYSHDGHNLNLVDWSAKVGIPRSVLWKRIHERCWSVEKALTTPLSR